MRGGREAMQQLAGLGKVAGIGGIALGVVVLLLRPLIEQVLPGLEPSARAEAVQVIAIGAFSLGALGIVTWAVSAFSGKGAPSVRTRGDRSVGIIAGKNVSFGSGGVPPEPAVSKEEADQTA